MNGRINILGVHFDRLTMEDTQQRLAQFLTTDRNHIVVTPNPEGVMQARRNPDFSAALNSADLSLADGTGIYLAAKYKRHPLPQRVRGVDTFFKLCERGNFSLYLLGAKPGVPEKAINNLAEKFPNINIVGHHHGYFSMADEDAIVADINEKCPDVLLVCLGMPRQEIWAAKNRNINAKITMCLGGTIDILAGEVKLAPAFLRKIGLEWLYRLVTNPRRFWRMLDIPKFMFCVVFK